MNAAETELLRSLPREELLTGGHNGMPGYGGTIALRQALKALGPRTILCIPASSLATVTAQDLRTALRVPLIHSLFECSAVIASGVRAALDAKGKTEVTVVSWAGDAGTADIGFQALSGAAERNEDIIHVCYDDEAYLNTGGAGWRAYAARRRDDRYSWGQGDSEEGHDLDHGSARRSLRGQRQHSFSGGFHREAAAGQGDQGVSVPPCPFPSAGGVGLSARPDGARGEAGCGDRRVAPGRNRCWREEAHLPAGNAAPRTRLHPGSAPF